MCSFETQDTIVPGHLNSDVATFLQFETSFWVFLLLFGSKTWYITKSSHLPISCHRLCLDFQINILTPGSWLCCACFSTPSHLRVQAGLHLSIIKAALLVFNSDEMLNNNVTVLFWNMHNLSLGARTYKKYSVVHSAVYIIHTMFDLPQHHQWCCMCYA